MISRFIIVSCALLIVAVQSQLRYCPISESLVEDIKSRALKELIQPSSIEEVYYASKYLSSLNVVDLRCSCDAINVLEPISTMETYYVVESAKTCNCKNVTPSSSALDAVSKGLKTGDLSTYIGAVLTSDALNSPQSLQSIIERISPLPQSSGMFRSYDSDEAPELLENSAKVATILAKFVDGKFDDIKFLADVLLKSLPNMEGGPVSDPLIFGNTLKLFSSKPKLSAAVLTLIGDLLNQQVLSTKLSIVVPALESLQTLLSYKTSPIYVELSNSRIGFSSTEKSVKVIVKNAMGQVITPRSIDVKSLKLADQKDSLFEGPVSEGNYDFSSLSLTPGRYALDLAITVEDRPTAINIKKFFAIVDRIVITDVLAGVTASKQTPMGDLTPIFREDALDGVEGKALESDVFHIAFTLKSESSSKFVKPHQVFVRFTHIESDTDTYFFAKSVRSVQDSTGAIYSAIISLADEIETFLHLSGKYSVEVVVGDYAYDVLKHRVGSVELKFPPKVVSDGPLYKKSLLHTSDNTLVALPEIVHVMRPPAKRASWLMSTIFTALNAVPLVGFVGFAISRTPNLSLLGHPSTFAFLLLVTGILALYVGYWFSLPGFSFYETIQYLLILLPATYFVGRSALAVLADSGSKVESKKQ